MRVVRDVRLAPEPLDERAEQLVERAPELRDHRLVRALADLRAHLLALHAHELAPRDRGARARGCPPARPRRGRASFIPDRRRRRAARRARARAARALVRGAERDARLGEAAHLLGEEQARVHQLGERLEQLRVGEQALLEHRVLERAARAARARHGVDVARGARRTEGRPRTRARSAARRAGEAARPRARLDVSTQSSA